tara:strand:+ start:624 stop:1145 length:522 start_codon:yes stop_codon:yes gene_type:complete
MKFKVFSYKKVNSTNNTAIALIKKNIKQGIVTSEIQKKGKGRIGKKWISRKGNLFISIFFPISKKLKLKKILNINLKIIKNIISQIIPYKINIKLPNDIKILKKKVCGILQEIIYINEVKFLIVGIGINIISSPNFLKYETTYLNKYVRKKIDKNKMLRLIKNNFEKKYELYV